MIRKTRYKCGWIGLLVLFALPVQGSEEASASGRITAELADEAVAEIRPQVAALRGIDFKSPVAVKVVDEEQTKRYVLERLTEFGVEDQLARTGKVYGLLGLVAPDVDILDALLHAVREQAGGFYDPAKQTLYLVDSVPAALTRVLAAHELTHALEDQHFGLDERIRAVIDDDDRSFAVGAVHEGSATLVMTLFTAHGVASGTIDLIELQEHGEAFARGAKLGDLEPVLVRQLLGPYLVGAWFMARGNVAGSLMQGYSRADGDKAFEDGPVSSEQILHPEKYWDERDDPLPVDMSDAGMRLGSGWSLIGEGVLGELVLAVMTGSATPMSEDRLMLEGGGLWTNEAASGWGGDRWQLWERKGKSVVLLSTRWDSERDAEEFDRGLVAVKGLVRKRHGDRVALVAGPAGKKTTAALDAMLGLDDAED